MFGFIKAWFTHEERRHIEMLKIKVSVLHDTVEELEEVIEEKDRLIEHLVNDIDVLKIEAEKTAKKASVDFIKKRSRKKKEYRRMRYADHI